MERAVLAVFGEAEFFFLKWEFIITDTGQQTRRYSAPIVRPAEEGLVNMSIFVPASRPHRHPRELDNLK